jgi:hypothetical protein
MTNPNPDGGMFSKLINPETAKPHSDPAPKAAAQPAAGSPSQKPAVPKEKPRVAPPLPTPVQHVVKKGAKDGKHQLGGWIPMETFAAFIQLHRSINPPIETIEKGYLLGLAVETFCKLLGNERKTFHTPEQLKAYVESKLKETT